VKINQLFKRISEVLSLCIFLSGSVVLIGWILDIPVLKSISPNFVTMKANTAICFILIGLSLWLSQTKRQDNQTARRIARLCAFAVFMIGFLTFLEYVIGRDFGIDQLLFKESATAILTSTPGRMAFNTSITFGIMGTALLLCGYETVVFPYLAQLLVIPAGIIALLSFVGYLYGANPLYIGLKFSTAQAVHTCVLFLMSCIGCLFVRPEQGFMKDISSDNYGGLMLRRILPVVILIPPVLGWLKIYGTKTGLFGNEFGVSFVATSNVVAFSLFVYMLSARLNRLDAKRKQTETVLQTEKNNLEAVFEASPIGMLLLNEKAEVIKINGVIEKLVGQYRLGDQPGNLFRCIHSLENPKGCGHSLFCPKCPIRNAIKTTLENGRPARCAEVLSTLLIDGKKTDVWLEVDAEPVVLDGKKYVIVAIDNISERKQVEDALKTSEEKSRLLLDSAGEAIYGIDMKGNCTFCNNSCLGLLGYKSPEDLLGRNMHWQIHSKRPDGTPYPVEECRIFQAFRKGEGTHVDNEVLWRADGTSFPAEFWSYPQLRDGAVVGAVVTFFDITTRKTAEMALRESEEKYKTLYESSHDAIMILTAGKGFISGNPATIKLFGCEDEKEFTSLSPVALSPKNQPDGTDSLLKAQEMINTAMEKGSHFFEWVHKRKDGTEFDATVLLTRIELKGEKVLQATVRDITERKKAEKEMKEAVEMKSKFISTASHELRTPLTSIKEGLNLVHSEMTGPLNNNQKEFLGIAKRNVDRLARLINDVLDYQKITAGRMDFDLKPANINETVRGVEETMRPLVKEKGLELIIELDDAVPMVKLDKDKIIQVLTNLVSNALKFTEKGSIKITTSRHEDNIRVSVQDSGDGIKQEDIPRLFQEFEQLATKDADRKVGGTGLGLAISKKIIENHSGRIWAESEYGKGTTFYFELPMEAIPCQIKS
jgi:PAS domain S-box-containing protein